MTLIQIGVWLWNILWLGKGKDNLWGGQISTDDDNFILPLLIWLPYTIVSLQPHQLSFLIYSKQLPIAAKVKIVFPIGLTHPTMTIISLRVRECLNIYLEPFSKLNIWFWAEWKPEILLESTRVNFGG